MSKTKPIKVALARYTVEELKEEIARRRNVERATRHIKSAEEALVRAQEKLKQYEAILRDDKDET